MSCIYGERVERSRECCLPGKKEAGTSNVHDIVTFSSQPLEGHLLARLKRPSLPLA